ncbi:hypothetical protein C0416_01595 [bacterium]|nr:hypothetical protein [bacterium]
MEKILKTLFIVGVVIATLLNLNPQQASAQSIQDCASQEGCVILAGAQTSVYRKGVLKGTIPVGGNRLSATNGWIIVTSEGSPDVGLYEIATGNMCSTMLLGEPCEEGIVILATNPLYSGAFMACPVTNELKRITLDCSSVFAESTSGLGASSLTPYGEFGLLVLNAGSGTMWGYRTEPEMGGWQSFNNLIPPTCMESPQKIRYWNNGVDESKIFISAGDIIYAMDADPIVNITTGTPPVFYTLPAGTGAGSLAINNEYMLAGSYFGSNAYLIEIGNPTTHVTLPVRMPSGGTLSYVAMSKDTAFVIDQQNLGVKAFSMDGTLLYTINESASAITYIAPTLPPVCSNNLVEGDETCDGTDFDGLDCTDYGFDGGALTCSPSCDAIFTSGCWSCGDGTMNPGEACDDEALGDASCTAIGYANGTVSCRVDCTVDYSQCYTCGNGLIEGAEECEGADLQGETCESQGFVGGTLTCTNCMLDTSTCHMCGNELTDEGELCDGTQTPGKICQTMGAGYTSGQLLCTSCNAYDTSACHTCGDGNVNPGEECDGANLNEQTCASLGLGSGTLSCFENCSFNATLCSDVGVEYCGNGNIDLGEECDDGNRSNSDDCSENCKIIPPTCGVGGIDPGEECDGEELGDNTCESLGYETGVLYCGGDCRLRKEACAFVAVPQNLQITLEGEPESGELSESLAQQYADLKGTLTYNCLSQKVGDDTVITTTEGSYCAVRALDLATGKKLFSCLYIPENPLERENPVLRFYQNGTIAQTFGGHISAYQGLEVKAVLVQDRLYNITQNRISSMGMKFLAVHPETQSRGRWLALNVGVGSTKFCTDEAGTTCALFLPKQGELVLNLDDLEDLTEIGWKTPKDPGGCSCSAGNNSNNSTSLPLLFSALALALLWRRRNRVR